MTVSTYLIIFLLIILGTYFIRQFLKLISYLQLVVRI